jgi:hypothetical protein
LRKGGNHKRRQCSLLTSMFSLISREFGKGQTGKGTTFSRAEKRAVPWKSGASAPPEGGHKSMRALAPEGSGSLRLWLIGRIGEDRFYLVSLNTVPKPYSPPDRVVP